MSVSERLERCHECREPVDVYASICRCPVWEFAIDEEGEPG
jgi:hypothetical protein